MKKYILQPQNLIVKQRLKYFEHLQLLRRVSEVKVCKSNEEGKIAFKIFVKISWLTELAEATLEQSLIKKFK